MLEKTKVVLHSRIKVMRLHNISLGSTKKSKSGLMYPTIQIFSENKMRVVREAN